ncbi:MAG TPA: hypothetical protein VG075_14220 [Candidatus Acidoferrum sp.]|nr:hypothetical protein [Candidatus Acidoferrum sp.]
MFNPPNPRYQGKPFLRLLELYVLWAIGELAEKEALILEEATPKLRSIYHREGDWKSIIAGEMEFPPHLPAKIRELWKRNLEKARTAGVVLPPQQFAELFVDDNFV